MKSMDAAAFLSLMLWQLRDPESFPYLQPWHPSAMPFLLRMKNRTPFSPRIRAVAFFFLLLQISGLALAFAVRSKRLGPWEIRTRNQGCCLLCSILFYIHMLHRYGALLPLNCTQKKRGRNKSVGDSQRNFAEGRCGLVRGQEQNWSWREG